MSSDLLWTLIAVQIALGGFDTLYHHEFTERLAWRASRRRELRLHAIRNIIYADLFLTGAVLMLAAPVLIAWAGLPTAITTTSYGWWSLMATVVAAAIHGTASPSPAKPAPVKKIKEAGVLGRS